MTTKPDTLSTSSRATPIALLVNLKKQLQFYLDRDEMSATRLAKKAGVPKQSLSGWLAGSNPRDVRQVKRVADVLGVSIDNLMFGEGEDAETVNSNSLDALLGDAWVGGLFEIRIRRVKKGGGQP